MSILQAPQDISINGGDTPTITILLNITDGKPFNGATSTASWYVGTTPNATGPQVVITKTVLNGGLYIALDPASGLWAVNIALLEADTSSLAPGAYYHTGVVVEQNGTRSHFVRGTFYIQPTMGV